MTHNEEHRQAREALARRLDWLILIYLAVGAVCSFAAGWYAWWPL